MSRTFRETPERLRRRSLHARSGEDRMASRETIESTPVTSKQTSGFRSSAIMSVPHMKQSLPTKGKPNSSCSLQKNTPCRITDENMHIVSSNNKCNMDPCITPEVGVIDSVFQSVSKQGSPLTPICNAVRSLKERIECKLGDSSVMERVSPGLARLRSTPGCNLKTKQAVLSRKHQSAKNYSSNLNVGGGVSLWPEMDNMRLTTTEVIQLVITCITLLGSTTYIYFTIHGNTHKNLVKHFQAVKSFAQHKVHLKLTDNSTFRSSVLEWHSGMQQCMYDIEEDFDVSLHKTAWTDWFCAVLYVAGIGTLLYFLYENIFAKSNLTPRRIKIWVCLLTVISTWTVLLIILLVQAQALELAVETAVHNYAEKLGILVYKHIDLSTYRNVLSYWTTRCLPPQTQGTLYIMGILAVRDVSYYLQYYSLPVITALVTPVFKLIVALKEIYSIKSYS